MARAIVIDRLDNVAILLTDARRGGHIASRGVNWEVNGRRGHT